MEEAHCHQHPIPPLPFPPRPGDHHQTPTLPLLPLPYSRHTPRLIPHFILLPLLTRGLPSSRWSRAPLPLPPRPSPPSGCRRTSSRVTSVVMHVNTSVSLAVCPRGVAAATHDFRHVPACGCHRLHRHPERLSKVGFSCSVAGRCSPSPPTSSPRTPPPRYLLAEFWLERQRKVGC